MALQASAKLYGPIPDSQESESEYRLELQLNAEAEDLFIIRAADSETVEILDMNQEIMLVTIDLDIIALVEGSTFTPNALDQKVFVKLICPHLKNLMVRVKIPSTENPIPFSQTIPETSSERVIPEAVLNLVEGSFYTKKVYRRNMPNT